MPLPGITVSRANGPTHLEQIWQPLYARGRRDGSWIMFQFTGRVPEETNVGHGKLLWPRRFSAYGLRFFFEREIQIPRDAIAHFDVCEYTYWALPLAMLHRVSDAGAFCLAAAFGACHPALIEDILKDKPRITPVMQTIYLPPDQNFSIRISNLPVDVDVRAQLDGMLFREIGVG